MIDAQLRDYIYNVVTPIVKNPDLAEDATQEALILVFRYRDSFKGDSKFRTWVHTIAVRAGLMLLRSRKHVSKHVELNALDDKGHNIPVCLNTPEKLAHHRRAILETLESVKKQGPAAFSTFFARFVLGCSDREVADAFNITIPAVKTRAHRARLNANRQMI